jgi:hypothetical protein
MRREITLVFIPSSWIYNCNEQARINFKNCVINQNIKPTAGKTMRLAEA